MSFSPCVTAAGKWPMNGTESIAPIRYALLTIDSDNCMACLHLLHYSDVSPQSQRIIYLRSTEQQRHPKIVWLQVESSIKRNLRSWHTVRLSTSALAFEWPFDSFKSLSSTFHCRLLHTAWLKETSNQLSNPNGDFVDFLAWFPQIPKSSNPTSIVE